VRARSREGGSAAVECAGQADVELERRLRALAPSCAYKVVSMAAALHISERQLRRVVRASYGMSPNRWLRRQRMRAVLELLMHAQSVKEVAFTLGHLAVSQFSRDFKNQFGCTPSSVLGQGDKLRALAATLGSSDDRF
jgi:AraC-like DNA-binding protein